VKSSAIQVHKSWLMRAALVLVVTCLVDVIVVWFAPQPFPWAVLIPGSLPLSMVIFVAMPLLKGENRESQTGAIGRD